MHLYGLKGFEDLERYSKYSQLSSSTNGAGKGYFLTLAMVYVDLTLGDVERLRGWEVLMSCVTCCSLLQSALLRCSARAISRSWFPCSFSFGILASIGINRHQSASRPQRYDIRLPCTLYTGTLLVHIIVHIISISYCIHFHFYRISTLKIFQDSSTHWP